MSLNPWALLTSADFLGAIQKLLPRGAAWPRDPAATQTAYFAAIADCVMALRARANDLSQTESDPSQTIELLPRWEARFGLPDPCTPANATIDQRHAALLSKMAAYGGQSPAYYIAVAAAMGVPITINTFAPFVAGGACGAGLYGAPWRFTWQVHSPTATASLFHAGSGAGEPLATWGNGALICRIKQIMPAHTTVLFASP